MPTVKLNVFLKQFSISFLKLTSEINRFFQNKKMGLKITILGHFSEKMIKID